MPTMRNLRSRSRPSPSRSSGTRCAGAALVLAVTVPAQLCTPVAYFGPVVQGHLQSSAQVDCYRFVGTGGDRVRVNNAWDSSRLYLWVEIRDSAGVLNSGWNTPQLDATLSGTGSQTYFVVFRERDSLRTGTYGFSLQRLDTAAEARDIYYGAPPVDCTLTTWAEVRRLRFEGRANKTVQFTTAWDSSRLYMGVEILDAAGGRVDYFVNQPTRSVTLPADGVYTVHVRERDLLRSGRCQLAINCVTFPCNDRVAARQYGTGEPGRNGIPALTSSGSPRIGTQIQLRLQNSSGSSMPGFLVAGLLDANEATPYCGRLLVVPYSMVPITVPPTGFVLPWSIPLDPYLVDLAIHLQGLQADDGATCGLSFSPGLTLLLGT